MRLSFFKIFILSLIALNINYIEAQAGSPTRIDIPSEIVRNFKLGNNKLPANVQGSPYLNDNFASSKVFIYDKNYGARLRYNAYLDEIQMKDKDNNNVALLKKDHVKAIIDGKEFKLLNLGKDKTGYGIVLSKGKFTLIKRFVKEYIAEQPATSSYGSAKPAKLIDKITYFILKEDGELQQIKLKKKEVLQVLGDKKGRLKEYISANKIKMKSENDLIQVTKFLNEL